MKKFLILSLTIALASTVTVQEFNDCNTNNCQNKLDTCRGDTDCEATYGNWTICYVGDGECSDCNYDLATLPTDSDFPESCYGCYNWCGPDRRTDDVYFDKWWMCQSDCGEM